jgi:hypothetical protein
MGQPCEFQVSGARKGARRQAVHSPGHASLPPHSGGLETAARGRGLARPIVWAGAAGCSLALASSANGDCAMSVCQPGHGRHCRSTRSLAVIPIIKRAGRGGSFAEGSTHCGDHSTAIVPASLAVSGQNGGVRPVAGARPSRATGAAW